MRLIDADEFKKQIAEMAIVNNYPADRANKMCELIDCQPTAYDVNKVVKKISDLVKPVKQYRYKFCGTVSDEHCAYYEDCEHCITDKTVEVVKSGGVSKE